VKPLVIGTRGSPLALAQAQWIRERLLAAHPGLCVEVRRIKTSGDLFPDASLVGQGGKGLFTKEIEQQLLAGEIDLAVHSMKDLPTTLPAGLTIGAVPAREDARDALVSDRYDRVAALPTAARVGTSSLRRRAQLLAQRPDLRVEPIRGNVETRLRKLATEGWDATLLAMAGLRRLGVTAPAHPLEVEEMIPAVGQGLLAVEVRESDRSVREWIAPLNVPAAAACGEAERSFLRAMGGGCQMPFAAHATVSGDRLRLVAGRFDPDGRTAQRAVAEGHVSEPVRIGEAAARELER
jgi:hydroxymethylbilane synthase